jgi:hypothetical protein
MGTDARLMGAEEEVDEEDDDDDQDQTNQTQTRERPDRRSSPSHRILVSFDSILPYSLLLYDF